MRCERENNIDRILLRWKNEMVVGNVEGTTKRAG